MWKVCQNKRKLLWFHNISINMFRLYAKNHVCYWIEESMNIVQFHEKTEVIMGELSQEVIEAYVKTGEPM